MQLRKEKSAESNKLGAASFKNTTDNDNYVYSP